MVAPPSWRHFPRAGKMPALRTVTTFCNTQLKVTEFTSLRKVETIERCGTCRHETPQQMHHYPERENSRAFAEWLSRARALGGRGCAASCARCGHAKAGQKPCVSGELSLESRFFPQDSCCIDTNVRFSVGHTVHVFFVFIHIVASLVLFLFLKAPPPRVSRTNWPTPLLSWGFAGR